MNIDNINLIKLYKKNYLHIQEFQKRTFELVFINYFN